MSVVYEPRNFLHDGSYPPIGEHEHDHNGDHRVHYSPPDMSDLSAYNLSTSMAADERSLMSEALASEAVMVSDAHLNLPSTHALTPLPSNIPDTLPSNDKPEDHEAGHEAGASARGKIIPKPDRDVQKQPDGKYYCTFMGCTEEIKVFGRRCEWSKHMDKHERPYRCQAEGCEKLAGFTYSGGLLRHEREVHGKHGGPKKKLLCPHGNCKRHTGKGFSRRENLNEHVRRVHTGDAGDGAMDDAISGEGGGDGTPAADDGSISSGDNDSDKGILKRKRSVEDEPYDDLREEIKRVRLENADLRKRMEQQSRDNASMMAQLAELQRLLQRQLPSGPTGGGASDDGFGSLDPDDMGLGEPIGSPVMGVTAASMV